MPHVAVGRVAALVISAAFACPAGAQAIYKWVDENGRTHYGEKPPDDVKSKKIDAPTPPSSPQPAKADNPQRWKDSERALRQEREDKERKENASASKDARARAQRESRCREAKIGLDRLANVHHLYRYDAKGERQYLTDADREAETQQYKKLAQEYCD